MLPGVKFICMTNSCTGVSVLGILSISVSLIALNVSLP